MTSLMTAAMKGTAQVVALLLFHGVDVNTKDHMVGSMVYSVYVFVIHSV